MSVVISDCKFISRNQLNNSKAKFLWSFGKDERFKLTNKYQNSSACYYSS